MFPIFTVPTNRTSNTVNQVLNLPIGEHTSIIFFILVSIFIVIDFHVIKYGAICITDRKVVVRSSIFSVVVKLVLPYLNPKHPLEFSQIRKI